MKKFTRRHYNKKLLALGMSAFMGIGLTSTGFAAWVMSKDAQDTAQGNINVSTITDASANIVLDPEIWSQSGDLKLLKTNLSFGAARGDTNGRLYGDGRDVENLTITISGKLYTDLDYVLTASIDNVDHLSGIKAAIKEGYIAWANDDCAFTVETIPGEDKTQVDNTVTINFNGGGTETTGEYAGKAYKTFSFDIAFTWGEKFGYMNPSLYYDTEGEDGGAGIEDAAMQAEMEKFWYMITGVSNTPDGEGKHPHEKESQNIAFTLTLRAEINDETA